MTSGELTARARSIVADYLDDAFSATYFTEEDEKLARSIEVALVDAFCAGRREARDTITPSARPQE